MRTWHAWDEEIETWEEPCDFIEEVDPEDVYDLFPPEAELEPQYVVYDDPFVFDVQFSPLNLRLLVRSVLGAALLMLLLLSCMATQLTLPPAAADSQPAAQAEALQTEPADTPAAEQAAEAQPAVNQECAVSGRFPQAILQWCGLITHYAQKRGLHPDLVAALIWQESGGKPQAYSKSGAVGLMQVMPRDGLAAAFRCANGPCFADRPSTHELQDPEFNINYGTRMLASLVRRHGNLRDGLKSYGPMDVGYYYADKVLGLFKQYGQP